MNAQHFFMIFLAWLTVIALSHAAYVCWEKEIHLQTIIFLSDEIEFLDKELQQCKHQ